MGLQANLYQTLRQANIRSMPSARSIRWPIPRCGGCGPELSRLV